MWFHCHSTMAELDRHQRELELTMNDLDRQIAELTLMTNTELKPSSGTLPNNSTTPGKKIGPAVPPKPKKNQPLVPQSYPLKQVVEPSYASRIQTLQPAYSNIYQNTQSHYSNAPTLAAHGKLAQPQQRPASAASSTYANLALDSQYSNMSRSGSAMSGSDYAPMSARAASSMLNQRGSVSSTHSSVAQGYGKPLARPGDQVTYSNVQMGPGQGAVRAADACIYSNLARPQRGDAGVVYSNLPPAGGNVYPNGDDLPPPPPPLEMSGALADYAPCTVNTNLPPPPEDLLPPPSPVSSSYSELRRATQPGESFGSYLGSQYGDTDSLYGYGGMSQSSSTYESIYEPINPRPPSQMSSRSNYSLYAPYVSGNASTLTGPSQSASRIGNKEHEVDTLTDLLVHGMDNDQEDVYGICVKCGEKIVGENSGCTAMDQLYHTKCFTCNQCGICLQGKPFYALDGNPYCEEDYLNTLEKCCVCHKPILDRILRATGKPYHPACFCCVACGKSLDGIPFTVDATNQVHCIEDFHKKFAPRCWVCQQPIMPEPGEEETVRVVAMDHSFHIQCYKCEDCGLVLSTEAEGRGCFPLDDHVLCKSCNAKRVQALTSSMTTEL